MATGLADVKLQLIGLITILWNTIEFEVQDLIWTVGNLDYERGHLITADIGNVSVEQLGHNFIAISKFHKRTKEEAKIVLSIFSAMRGKRNALVHGRPRRDENGKLVGTLARFSAKKRKGKVEIEEIAASEQYLESLASDMVRLSEFIHDSKRKMMNEINYRAAPPATGSLESFVFAYRAPEIDIAVLKKHQDRISDQPPKQNKAPKKQKAPRRSP